MMGSGPGCRFLFVWGCSGRAELCKCQVNLCIKIINISQVFLDTLEIGSIMNISNNL